MSATEVIIEPGWRRRLTVAEYHRLVDAHVLDDDKYEFLEGDLVALHAQQPPEARVITWLNRVLIRSLDDGFQVRPQLPLTLARSEPGPDVAVVATAEFERAPRHPETALLVIEVADTTLRKDRLVKAPVYAGAGVAEYWIVNVAALQVERHRDPDSAQRLYRRSDVVASGELDVESLPGLRIDVSELLRAVRRT